MALRPQLQQTAVARHNVMDYAAGALGAISKTTTTPEIVINLGGNDDAVEEISEKMTGPPMEEISATEPPMSARPMTGDGLLTNGISGEGCDKFFTPQTTRSSTPEGMEEGNDGFTSVGITPLGGSPTGHVKSLVSSFGGGNGILRSPNSAFQTVGQAAQLEQQMVQQSAQMGTRGVSPMQETTPGTYPREGEPGSDRPYPWDMGTQGAYDSTVCSMAYYMLERKTRDEVLDMLGKTFRADELTAASQELRYMKNLPPVLKRISSINRSAAVAAANDLLVTMEELDNRRKQPQYMLKCEDIKRCMDIEKASETNGDARIKGMEDCMTKMMERMEAMTRTMAAMQQQMFSNANRNQGGGRQQNNQRRQGGVQRQNETQRENTAEVQMRTQAATGAAPAPVLNAVPTQSNTEDQTQQTFASITAKNTDIGEEDIQAFNGNNQMSQQEERRERSGSFKRIRNNSDGEWTLAGGRRRRNGKKGGNPL